MCGNSYYEYKYYEYYEYKINLFACEHNSHSCLSKMGSEQFFLMELEWRRQTDSNITIEEQMISATREQKHVTKSLFVREGGRGMGM